MKFEPGLREGVVHCIDRCLWCDRELRGRGADEAAARTDCARKASAHLCKPKLERNRRPATVPA